MSFQPEFQEINSVKRIELAKSSEIVTFKMVDNTDSGIGKVLSKKVDLCISKKTCERGEIRYTVSVFATLSFIDLSGNIRSISYTGDIDGKQYAENAMEMNNLCLKATVLDVSIEKIVGSDITIALAYEISGSYFVSSLDNVLLGGEGFFVSTADGEVTSKFISDEQRFTLEEEFSTQKDLSLVMTTSAQTVIDKITTGLDIAVIEGKHIALITYLTTGETGEIVSEKFDLPFREEISLRGANIGDMATACARVCSINVVASTDEVKHTSVVKICINSKAQVMAFKESEVEMALDVFSCENELLVTRENLDTFEYEGRLTAISDERTSIKLDSEYEKVVAITAASAEVLSHSITDDGLVVDGMVKISAIMFAEDSYASKDFEIPVDFVLALDEKENLSFSINIVPIAESLTLKMADEIEAFVSAQVFVDIYENNCFTIITDITKGEEKSKEYSAIVVYIAKGGESLLDIAKELNTLPNIIEEQNSELAFPLAAGDKVVIYRQRTK